MFSQCLIRLDLHRSLSFKINPLFLVLSLCKHPCKAIKISHHFYRLAPYFVPTVKYAHRILGTLPAYYVKMRLIVTGLICNKWIELPSDLNAFGKEFIEILLAVQRSAGRWYFRYTRKNSCCCIELIYIKNIFIKAENLSSMKIPFYASFNKLFNNNSFPVHI